LQTRKPGRCRHRISNRRRRRRRDLLRAPLSPKPSQSLLPASMRRAASCRA
jgi:hypothetical protein